MNPLLFDSSLLKESREFFEARVPKILGVFVYLVITILFMLFFWAVFWEIEITARAPLLIRPVEYVSIVRNVVAGPAASIDVKNGDMVLQGQTLWRIDPRGFDIELERARPQAERTHARLVAQERLSLSQDQGRNLMRTEDGEFLLRWFAYFNEWQRLQLLVQKAALMLQNEKATPSALTTPIRIEQLETDLQIAQVSLQSWLQQQQGILKAEIEETKRQMESLVSQIQTLEKQRAESEVRAPVEGMVEVMKRTNPLDYLGVGEEILRIVPQIEGPLKMEIHLADKDIAEVRPGQAVKIRLNGFPPSDYGFLTGVVTVVPPDSGSSPNGQVIYKIEGELNQRSLSSRNGETSHLQAGMTGEARIILKKKTILLYLLELLDFIA